MSKAHQQKASSRVRKAFERHVLPAMVGPSRGHPRLLVFNGTQGSRKTTLSRWLATRLGMQRPFLLEGDDLFAALPGFKEFARKHGGVRAQEEFLGDYLDLRKLTNDTARANRRDIAMVGVFTEADFVAKEVRPFAADGYRTDLATSVVPPAFSLAHMVVRDAQQAHSGETRLPLSGPDVQRGFHEGMVEVIRAQGRDNLFQGIHLVTAQGAIISTERRHDGRWAPTAPGSMADRADELRGAPWTLETTVDHGRLMEKGRQTLADAPVRDRGVRRDLLRAAGQDAAARPGSSSDTGLSTVIETVARATGAVAPAAAPDRGNGSAVPRTAQESATGQAVPATFRRPRAPKQHPGLTRRFGHAR
ncbi:zeta toxin family protein [Yinghuangia sp. ASG 101]|uniref:zeta toxin family protein n=1 Tax=Yinghuangia sp. ASG 101 TaxID=2896848 RepID=UPI001E35D914|nr:zeta toxin family protein [Yinghuangia sp. ASG 101]UGQ11461.1 zeta toxin family protein [Yinghuangia sp. ASG 101]